MFDDGKDQFVANKVKDIFILHKNDKFGRQGGSRIYDFNPSMNNVLKSKKNQKV